MPIRVTCPGCCQQLTLPDDVRGKQIGCEFCSRALRIGAPAQTGAAPKPPAKPAAPMPAAKPAPVPQPAAKNTSPGEFNIDRPASGVKTEAPPPAPAKPKTPPAARQPPRRPAEEDEPIIRPRDARRPATSAGTWWVLGSLAALVLFGAGVGLAFLVHDGVSPDRTATPEVSLGRGEGDRKPDDKKPDDKKPVDDKKQVDDKKPVDDRKPVDDKKPVDRKPVDDEKPVEPNP